ncbi:hypothetical protein Pryu01_00107 [Paraliobacillus ryukyuensis]|uniref:YlqD protein n=1 Tax=Paraliobacillus ryukyuensis TaxID=200904 RepID=A0A366EH89_9BACI|nr:YlqD family protein [Paraliobacillus ryukyuensis]RBP01821.1 YlqD protein [Paraliobacillus ryukyuensis]
MQIIKKVKVKQIITEASKTVLLQKFQNRIQKLEQEIQQLKFEQKKLEHQHKLNRQKVIVKFKQELDKRTENIRFWQNQLEQIHTLPLESEIFEREVDALTEVEVGTKWDNIMTEQVIVIKDGTVIRIDEVGE